VEFQNPKLNLFLTKLQTGRAIQVDNLSFPAAEQVGQLSNLLIEDLIKLTCFIQLMEKSACL